MDYNMKFTLLVLALSALTIEANLCGGNCPSNNCQYCPCGNTTSLVSAATWCSKFTGWSQTSCQCIISKESASNANAMNFNTGCDVDVGLWQINSFNWVYCGNFNSSPCKLSENLDCAKQVFAWGSNTWKFWATCGACGVCNSK